MFTTCLILSALTSIGSTQYAGNGALVAGGIFGGGLGSLAAFPTGNGTNAAILTNDSSQTLSGQFNNTYWTLNGFDATYSLFMSPTADSAIFPNYGRVGINFGLTTPGFAEGNQDGLLIWNNTDMANAGSYFGLCPTLIPGFEAAGVQQQIFWQSNEAPEYGTANCTTFIFHGAYGGVQTH